MWYWGNSFRHWWATRGFELYTRLMMFLSHHFCITIFFLFYSKTYFNYLMIRFFLISIRSWKMLFCSSIYCGCERIFFLSLLNISTTDTKRILFFLFLNVKIVYFVFFDRVMDGKIIYFSCRDVVAFLNFSLCVFFSLFILI